MSREFLGENNALMGSIQGQEAAWKQGHPGRGRRDPTKRQDVQEALPWRLQVARSFTFGTVIASSSTLENTGG